MHEGLHGVYFTEESFRREVDEVFYATDPISLRFLKRYFEVNPSLNYNTDDSYLFKNEFMAYTLQQSVGEVKNYYIDRLARIINSAEPELCAYIRDTDAAAFTQAAETMSAFLAKKQAIVETILSKHDAATNGRRFNAFLATSSINDAIEYYHLFKKAQKAKTDCEPLNIACVFTPPAEGNKDIMQMQKNLAQ